MLVFDVINNKYNISDSSLVGGDTLTCGECKRDFKLQELTLFIQHKALNSCKNFKLNKTLDSEYDEVSDEISVDL